jgi:glutathione synthase/RimK-type ligase-like ATP-grasp enzyme
VYFCCHDEALWVNPLPALHRSRLKLQQLQLARRVGLKVPKTIVTNDAEAAVAFCREVKRACTKSLDEPNFKLDGHLYPMLTRVVDGADEVAARRASIERCPVLFQEYIEKRLDLRVIVMGEMIFPFEIHSQEHPLSLHDSRGVAPHFLEHRLHKLPVEVSRKILAFVRRQGLVFSALDFVLSAESEYCFLENNPNGQWLWLEMETGFDLSEKLIGLLLGEQKFQSPV